MNEGLDSIAVRVEDRSSWTGNVTPLLHEIRHALRRLVDHGTAHVIDLRGLPMAPGEQDRLEQVLGRGELSARLDALGPSEIVETAYAGVWLVTHRNGDGQVVGKFIEVTHAPELLRSQDADVGDALARMERRLAAPELDTS